MPDTSKLIGKLVKSKTATPVELSIVIPCLNEADTLETCINKCKLSLERHEIDGEIIIADNGSTDGSIQIASTHGCRVVHVNEKGYGNALQGGIAEAKGKYVIMGDADDSYDFLDIPRFVEKLREGNELVMGCRLPAGGGTVLPGAMPPLHRWLGNPALSALVRRWFRAPVHDVYCGLRGFSKALYKRLDLRCTGMEFATEMVIKASLFKAQITEIPITLHPDGRKAHRPHLRTFQDGWRTLRFFLIYSPRWLFLVPGTTLMLLGALGYILALPGITVMGMRLDAHTLLFASLFILLGYQAIQFAVFAKTFAVSEKLLPRDERLEKLLTVVSLERGILLGALATLGGCLLLAMAVVQWQQAGFGDLDYAVTMRIVIPGVTLCALGVQTILARFFISLLNMSRR